MEEPKESVKEDSDVDCDVGSDVEEEEKTKEDIGVEEPKSQDQEEKSSEIKEEVKSKEKPRFRRFRRFRSDIREALSKEKKEWSKEAAKDFVKGLKLWEDLKPRRVQAPCACVGGEETQLSFEAGAVMDGARPAAWLVDGWLEATLDGRDGLVFLEEVKYLPDHSDVVNVKAVSGLTDNPGPT